ncbi:Uncharacterised protein [Mycobacterium tuberculosis]|nr:Uncharacterised protein [Mycobacterium tuberculosis]
MANAALILSLPPPPAPGIGTYESRGIDTAVGCVLDPNAGRWISRMVSVRPLPMSPPVDSACCCSTDSACRLSDPTSSQLVPRPAAGRSA